VSGVNDRCSTDAVVTDATSTPFTASLKRE
jgi:hypothetical protein